MTVQELCAVEGVNLCYFDGEEWHSQGFYNPVLNVLALDIHLSDDDQRKVALHELGHREHLPCNYQMNREKCELQANRNMIHHLLEAELKELDDVSNFNYVRFMKTYKLKTIADEEMVKEEFYNLINNT
ncbi:ImmA/IrrE family metallo-endopeptidase [Streptococcus gordonii]|uniref:ImmA/IrrE family metallo-endopeptidase n=1 Tax=Streptococcus gordonii TaxID=1302 RepID=UPI002000C113|nr:ImmA/IrrE family metallo-endopeptidase [Streptococcus gordonii]